ncbi:MAG: MBL fold metallo-hydrolase [Rickettsia sp.]|nr:MBL fold metallo-hydrolase [Rickettsia sp.]
MLKIVIMGCGSSLGTPVIGCDCNVCMSNNIFNKRSRTSILVQTDTFNLLIDSGYDIRNQILREDISKLDAVILTHPHSDHIGGLDDLRSFYYINQVALPIFANKATADIVFQNFHYLFESKKMQLQIIEDNCQFRIFDLDFTIFKHLHGKIGNISIKIKDFVYSCDVSAFLPENEENLKNLDHWILDCINYEGTSSHIGFKHILELNKKFQPKKIYLTGLSHIIEYSELSSKIPKNCTVLHDGYQIYI